MEFAVSPVLVCTGTDTAQAASTGLPLLQLCLGITESGALRRLQLPTAAVKTRYLGLRDLPRGLTSVNAQRLAADLVYEIQQTQAAGLFADLEYTSVAHDALLVALDEVFHQAGYPLFVPLSAANRVHYAILTVETAISGGSLTEYIKQLQKTHGEYRIAALLRPLSNDFLLPSETPDGTPLAPEAREVLRRQVDANVFFSRELCAKYFTYMDEKEAAHFVLFDDATTLEAKLRQLASCHVQTVFALWPDLQTMLTAP